MRAVNDKHFHYKLLLLTPIFILLSHYLAVFAHEYAHSFMAWILGAKENPFAINYGGTSWANLLLLVKVDENVDYATLLKYGKDWQVALIGFSGPGIANGSLYLLYQYYLKKMINHQYLFYFAFWFNFMNLANLYDYVPIRIFDPSGDMANIVIGLHVSPWALLIVLGSFVLLAAIYFFRRTLPLSYQVLNLSQIARLSLAILCIMLLLGYFAIPGLLAHDSVSRFIAVLSISSIPLMAGLVWLREKEII